MNVANVFCEIYGISGHIAMNCQVEITPLQGVQMEQANVINNYTQRPQNNLYSSTYNPG